MACWKSGMASAGRTRLGAYCGDAPPLCPCGDGCCCAAAGTVPRSAVRCGGKMPAGGGSTCGPLGGNSGGCHGDCPATCCGSVPAEPGSTVSVAGSERLPKNDDFILVSSCGNCA